MDPLAHLKQSDTLAHAYIVFGGQDTFQELKLFAEERVGGKGNPDALCFQYDSMGVDEARELSSLASLKPLGERKFVVVSFQQSTTEAQNALLKIIEDGVGHTTFLFATSTGTPLLPTLLSRCVVLKQLTADSLQLAAGKDFLKMGYAERMEYVEKLGKDGDRDAARTLVSSLLAAMAAGTGAQNERSSGLLPSVGQTFHFAPRSPEYTKAMRNLLEAEGYLKLSGSSVKSVLGLLALTL